MFNAKFLNADKRRQLANFIRDLRSIKTPGLLMSEKNRAIRSHGNYHAGRLIFQ